MVDWGKRVFLGSLVGAIVGVLIGGGLTWLLWPPAATTPSAATAAPTSTTVSADTATPVPQPTDTPTGEATSTDVASAEPAPNALVPDREIILVSALYALDGDLERAQQRLVGLGLDDPAAAVAELALHHADQGNDGLATDLATLAAALGQAPTELVAYVATPTPTPTFTPSPTATPEATATNAPAPQPTRRPTARPQPSATPPPPPPTALPWDWWDHRVDLLEPPIKLIEAQVAPGERYWRLMRLEWRKPGEGGNTLLYVTTIDEKGQPVWGQEVIVEHGVQERLYTDPKPGEPYGVNYPMSGSLNSYQVFVGGDLPSDRVTGLGLGEWPGGTDHTSFILIFQRSRK
jgi:hypothetical protein